MMMKKKRKKRYTGLSFINNRIIITHREGG